MSRVERDRKQRHCPTSGGLKPRCQQAAQTHRVKRDSGPSFSVPLETGRLGSLLTPWTPGGWDSFSDLPCVWGLTALGSPGQVACRTSLRLGVHDVVFVTLVLGFSQQDHRGEEVKPHP